MHINDRLFVTGTAIGRKRVKAETCKLALMKIRTVKQQFVDEHINKYLENEEKYG